MRVRVRGEGEGVGEDRGEGGSLDTLHGGRAHVRKVSQLHPRRAASERAPTHSEMTTYLCSSQRHQGVIKGSSRGHQGAIKGSLAG